MKLPQLPEEGRAAQLIQQAPKSPNFLPVLIKEKL
jgi:hypothetical protein